MPADNKRLLLPMHLVPKGLRTSADNVTRIIEYKRTRMTMIIEK